MIIVSSTHPLDRSTYASFTLFFIHTGRALNVTIHCLMADPDTRNVSDLSSLVHTACDATGLKQKVFMTALRHALTAMKVGFSPLVLPPLTPVICLRVGRPSPKRSTFLG